MSKGLFFRYCSTIIVPFLILQLAWLLFPSVFDGWDLEAGDQLTRVSHQWQGNRPISPEIVHVDLDDNDLRTIDFTENDPRLYAELIRILDLAGVRSVLVDILFPVCKEKGCTSFYNEVEAAGSVHFPVILSPDNKEKEAHSVSPSLPESTFWQIDSSKLRKGVARGQVLISNFSALNKSASGLGHINAFPDVDGVYRRIPLLIDTASGIIPSLALRTACHYLDVPIENIDSTKKDTLILHDTALPDGRVLDIKIPLGVRTKHRINFSGPWTETFAHYSFATILEHGKTPEGLLLLTDELEDSLVIISDVSTSGRDFGPVPFSPYTPLSCLHSNFINSLLNNDFLTETTFAQNLFLDFILFLLLLVPALYLKGSRFVSTAILLYCLFVVFCFFLFFKYRTLIPIVRPSLSFFTAVILVILFQFLDVQKEKQYIRATFTNYFSPSLMSKILKNPGLIGTVSRKKLTILFSDIVNFSTWASTQDAEVIHRTLNDYFDKMAEIVFKYEGTIDKYMGDGLMVFFGDPEPHPDHALRAVNAAREMQQKTKELREQWSLEGRMSIEIRIGVHSGEVVVGNMGSRSRMEYTVIGSDVNLAQRLESNCPPGKILISQEVADQLSAHIHSTPMGTIKAKGFNEQIPAFIVDPV